MITTPKQLRKQVSRGGDPYSLDFDGTDDYVEHPLISFADREAYTYSVWVKWFENNNPSGFILPFGDYNTTSTIYLSVGSGSPYFRYRGEDGHVFDIDSGMEPLYDGTWHNLAWKVSTSGTISVFIDGGLIDDKTLADTEGSGFSYNGIGAGYSSTSYLWHGSIDDVRIYNRALSANEISKLYKGVRISRVGLVGHWKFDEGEGTVAHDVSGNGNDGDIVDGGATWVEDTPL